MKRLSWKYMAGIIDGEGCIDMQTGRSKKTGKLYARPRLRMTLVGDHGKMMVEMMEANFGGNLEHLDRGNPNWQETHTWVLTGQVHLRALLQNIVNHMILKQEQAKLAIWWIDNMTGKRSDVVLQADPARRFAIDEMKAMKRDPQRLSGKAVESIIKMLKTDAIVQTT